VDLPLEACRQVLEAAMEEFVQQTTAESNWRVPEHILERFPEDVRILFRPEQLAS
jgi:hypothetical protein